MANQRLISLMRRGMARRIPLEKIRIDMLGMGFSNDQFENAMAEINAGGPMVRPTGADKSSLADVSKKSRMFVWIGIMGGLLLIGAIVLFFIFTGGDSDDGLGVPPDEPDVTPEDSEGLFLSIDLEKSTYVVGEPFEAQVSGVNNGNEFRGVLLYLFAKEGVERISYAKSIQDFGESINGNKIKAYYVSPLVYQCCEDQFSEEGVYIIKALIYSCHDVEELLSVECGEADWEDIVSIVPSLVEEEVRVTVVGEGDQENPPEEPECTSDFNCEIGFVCEVGECVEEPELEIPDQGGLVNCGDDYVCFISAAEVCENAQVLRTTTFDILGIVATSLTHEFVRGELEGKCLYAQKTIDFSLYFSEELVQQLLDSGQTQEEITQAEQELNEGSDEFLNLEHECRFDTGDLSAMLLRWSEGTFDEGPTCFEIESGWDCTYTGDWALGENCTSMTVP